jgi:hypothetical protein
MPAGIDGKSRLQVGLQHRGIAERRWAHEGIAFDLAVRE